MTYEQATARCWAEIDLGMVRHNLRTAREECPGVQVIPVLKADAYGLGAERVARALAKENVPLFAVAEYTEAAEIKGVCGGDVLVMGHTAAPFFGDALEKGIILTLVDLENARALNDEAGRMGKKARVHVKIDTGLHRLGFDPDDTGAIMSAFALENLSIEGMFTHLALRGRESDDGQMRAFMGAVDAVRAKGFDPGLVHALDSDAAEARVRLAAFLGVARALGEKQVDFGMLHALDSIGMLLYPEYRLDAVRVGAWIYGSSNRHFPNPEKCPLPMKLKARVTQVRRVKKGQCLGYDDEHPLQRDSVIATVGCGYYDGVPRACAAGFAVVRRMRAPIAGLVMMDQLTLDVTDIPGVTAGDEVTFLGDGISLLEASQWYHWNRNELMARMSRRVQKIYSE